MVGTRRGHMVALRGGECVVGVVVVVPAVVESSRCRVGIFLRVAATG